MAFDKLVRFERNGKISYGNLVGITDDGFQVTKLEGGISEGFRSLGDEVIHVEKVSALDFYMFLVPEAQTQANLTIHTCA
jgi:hypothetical protein